MNLLILIGVIATSAILAVRGYEFQSVKSNVKWDGHIPATGMDKYRTDGDWSKPAGGDTQNEFYQGVFTTRVDHFRPQNQDRVNFTYHVNANHFQPGSGPLYIFLKDYRDFSTQWIENGLMVDIAREQGAALLTFDHRYFGRNRPTDTTSFENLELLSVEQSLADVAEFVRFVREYIGFEEYSRVIVWGSGFGGVLAAWARSRYPHLIHAVWSSSGYLNPVVAAYGPYDLLQYTFLINDAGVCRELIREAYLEIARMVLANEGEQLAEEMNLCHPVVTDSEADVASLYELTVRAILSYVEQYHYLGVQEFCGDLSAIEGDPLASFARWTRYVYGDEECFDHSYATMLERNTDIEWDQVGTDTGRRQWYFLQCTQIGSFMLADSYTWLAGNVTLEFHIQKCADIFGVEFNINQLQNAFYAMMNEFSRPSIDRAIFTNGMFDPLRYFGKLYDRNEEVVINIDFASKSADLRTQTTNDPESLFEAKTIIREHIELWSNEEVIPL